MRFFILTSILFLLAGISFAVQPKKASIHYEIGAGLISGKEFILNIDEKGAAILIAKNGFPIKGQYKRMLVAKEKNEINVLLNNLTKQSLHNEYDLSAEDTPLKILTYRNNKKSNTIKYKGPAPRILQQTDSLMLVFANSNNWQKIKP